MGGTMFPDPFGGHQGMVAQMANRHAQMAGAHNGLSPASLGASGLGAEAVLNRQLIGEREAARMHQQQMMANSLGAIMQLMQNYQGMQFNPQYDKPETQYQGNLFGQLGELTNNRTPRGGTGGY